MANKNSTCRNISGAYAILLGKVNLMRRYLQAAIEQKLRVIEGNR